MSGIISSIWKRYDVYQHIFQSGHIIRPSRCCSTITSQRDPFPCPKDHLACITCDYSGLREDCKCPRSVGYMDPHLKDILGFVQSTLKPLLRKRKKVHPVGVSMRHQRLRRPPATRLWPQPCGSSSCQHLTTPHFRPKDATQKQKTGEPGSDYSTRFSVSFLLQGLVPRSHPLRGLRRDASLP